MRGGRGEGMSEGGNEGREGVNEELNSSPKEGVNRDLMREPREGRDERRL